MRIPYRVHFGPDEENPERSASEWAEWHLGFSAWQDFVTYLLSNGCGIETRRILA